jgi:hypothetical protein
VLRFQRGEADATGSRHTTEQIIREMYYSTRHGGSGAYWETSTMEDRDKMVRLNIEYYRKLYAKDPDETRRQMLMRYLDEEQARWSRSPSRVTAQQPRRLASRRYRRV